MFPEWIRKNTFWALDALKGKPIYKHYKDIREIMENEKIARERCPKYLDKLMKHAVETTNFYSKYKDYTKLEDFPIIDKNIIKQNYDKFLSKTFKDKSLHSISTSGSTGTPFTVLQSPEKRLRVLAELIYFSQWAGYDVGTRHIFFRALTGKNRKSNLKLFAQNEIAIDPINFNDLNFEKVRQILKKDKGIKILIGYASTYDALTDYLLSKDDTPDMYGVCGIVSGSEILYDNTRQKLKKVFDCTVVSRYSNQENGVLAQDCNQERGHHVNIASYCIEFLKLDSDEPAELGEPARIIVTDLFNYAMPMLRYNTGDVGILDTEKCTCQINTPILKSIEGRRTDIVYDTKGEMISPHSISINFWGFDNIRQFQFIQDDQKDYRIRLSVSGSFTKEQKLINIFKKILGKDANITIEYTNEIPILASRKRKYIVCNYKPR